MSDNHRVLMLGTDPSSKGGIASVIRSYAEAGILSRLGVFYVSTHIDGSGWKKALHYLASILKAMRSLRGCRIIHLHVASRWSFRRLVVFGVGAVVLSKKLVLHLHGGKFDIFYRETGEFEKTVIRWVFGKASRVIVLSEGWLMKLRGFIPNRLYQVIPNGIQVQVSTGGCGAQKIRGHRLILLMGEIGARKGVYDLLETLRLLNRKNVAFEAWLCGEGEIELVRKRVLELGLQGRVTVPGWVEGDTKNRLLERAHVYVLPSYFEGLPVSVLEALASGTPVIATPVGGIPSVIEDGVNGFLVPVSSPLDIASRIEQLFEDESLWQKLSEGAYQTALEKFSIEQTEVSLRALYEDLCRD